MLMVLLILQSYSAYGALIIMVIRIHNHILLFHSVRGALVIKEVIRIHNLVLSNIIMMITLIILGKIMTMIN